MTTKQDSSALAARHEKPPTEPGRQRGGLFVAMLVLALALTLAWVAVLVLLGERLLSALL